MFPFDNFINDDWIDGDLFDTDDIANPILGTNDSDLILSDASQNEMQGLAGDDLLIGGSGVNTFIGGEGNDVLNGLSGYSIVKEFGDYDFTLSNTQLIADDGNGNIYTDLLFGMDEADLHATGAGDNIIDVTAFSGVFTVLRVDDGTNTIYGSDSDQTTEKIFGGLGVDTIEGNGGDDEIFGNEGNDIISGGAGDDYLYGEEDHDILSGNSGVDYINGGEGNDTISGGSNNDVIDGGGGIDTLLASGDFDFTLTDTTLITQRPVVTEVDDLASIENAVLDGGVSSNIIDASGFSGTVTLRGEGGADTLIGGAGNDVIVGGSLNDTLTSGSMNDQDIFLYENSLQGGDIITDFRASLPSLFIPEDMIYVEASGFLLDDGVTLAFSIGVLSSSLLVDVAGSLGSDAGFRYNDSSGALLYDNNGDDTGGTSLLATLTNAPTLAQLNGNIQVV